MAKTKIEWATDVINPIVGCSPIGAGCKNCFAQTMAGRLDAMGKEQYKGLTKDGKWTGETRLVPHMLEQPLHWRKPRRIFVCSMGDLFHESVPNEDIAKVFGVMAACPQHTFLVLTKRPKRMREWFAWLNASLRGYLSAHCGYLCDVLIEAGIVEEEAFAKIWGAGLPPPTSIGDACSPPYIPGWPLPNVHLGVSVSNQDEANRLIPELLLAPAAVWFVSAEPLLGPIDFGLAKGLPVYREADTVTYRSCPRDPSIPVEAQQSTRLGRGWGRHDGNMQPWLNQVIVGGEATPGARPLHPDWVRSIRDQCQAAGVAFFFKQWGEWIEGREVASYRAGVFKGKTMEVEQTTNPNQCRRITLCRVGKRTAGRELDGRTWEEVPG